MKGICIILGCWLAGNILSEVIGGYISGNIIGMLLLFILLCLGVVRGETVCQPAKFLLGTMALFFVPFGVGIIDSYSVILDNAVAIVVAVCVSTFAVIATVGYIFQLLNRRGKNG